jgi:hydroxymethylpyrimidine/phosphomethylpyrimidine kinase
MAEYITALTIAGSDPSGGAGMQADLKTFSALGCYGLSVLTALPAQNTQGVQGIQEIPESFVALQLQSIFQDIRVAAAKTGMLHNAKIIQHVARFFEGQSCPLIVDPVISAKDGSLLLESDAITVLKERLIPLATILTPNLLEAEMLWGQPINSPMDMENAANFLASLGATAVLIKGGHMKTDQSNDCLYLSASQETIWLNAPRIVTQNTHGTGCTLSAAITAMLAKGAPLLQAVQQAKDYLFSALQAGAVYTLGNGHGPVHHFYQFWE